MKTPSFPPTGLEQASPTEPMRPVRISPPQLLLWVLLLGASVASGSKLGMPPTTRSIWLVAAVGVLAIAVNLVALRVELPVQNLVATSLILFAAARCLAGPGILAGLDWGPKTPLMSAIPWALAAVSVAVILSARGTARLVLKPIRSAPNYGVYIFALTILLLTLFALGFEPFVDIFVGSAFSPPALRTTATRFGVPWYGFVGWAAGSGLGLLLATPFLIKKRPGTPVTSLQPFAVWILLNCVGAMATLLQRSWPAAVLVIGLNLVGPSFAVLRAQASLRHR